MTGMTLGDKQRRRRKIATYVAAGHTADAAAKEFGCTLNHVKNSCREFGVEITRDRPDRAGTVYTILASLLNTDDPLAEVARQHNITRQRAAEIYKLARAAGIDVPTR